MPEPLRAAQSTVARSPRPVQPTDGRKFRWSDTKARITRRFSVQSRGTARLPLVNYLLVGNILRKVERLEDELSADATAAAHLQKAEDAALAITAVSTKADVRDARSYLRLAQGDADVDGEDSTAPAV